MLYLFKAEIGRFARWSIGFGVLHLATLFLLDRTFPWMRDDGEIAIVLAFAYAALGLLLGLYQSASYARLSHWIALLHRPLPPWRILTAIHGASAAILFAAVVVPLLIFTWSLTLQAGRVVDARHWLSIVAGGLISLVGLGVGSYLALSPRRYGWTAIVAASVWTVGSSATGGAALLLYLFILAVLALLLAGAFKPDLSLLPSDPVLLAATAGVAAVSLFYLTVLASGLSYQIGLAAIGRNPEMNAPRPGGIVEAFRSDGEDLFSAALKDNAGAESLKLRDRLTRASFKRLPLASSALPSGGELMNSGPIAFTNGRDNVRWTYSHDANVFLGLHLRDHREMGQLKPTRAFVTPPMIIDEEALVAGRSLYKLDPAGRLLRPVFEVAPGERIVTKPVTVGDRMAVMSDQALYLVSGGKLEGSGSSDKVIVVPIPAKMGDLQRIDTANLPDQLLVSFLLGRDGLEGPANVSQTVVSISRSGVVSTVAERSLVPEYSDMLRYRSYVISPLLRAITAAISEFGSASAWVAPRTPIDIPVTVWIAAALSSLVAACVVAARAIKLHLSRLGTATWAIATGFFGIPMLAVFMLLVRPHRLTSRAAY